MTTNGGRNDLSNNLELLCIIVPIPPLSGFVMATIPRIIGTVVQWRIYKTYARGYQATNCAEAPWIVSTISVGTCLFHPQRKCNVVPMRALGCL